MEVFAVNPTVQPAMQPTTQPAVHPFLEYVNPHLGDLLEKVRLDKRFVRGEGAWLWDAEGRRYLDFIAAYGALPFGFNPPEIWEALEGVRRRQEPSFVQPSALDPAGELARRLIELAPEGLRYVTFVNSGAEATEAAIKLVRSKSGRRGILATHNSFHGKTLGALSATGRRSYQKAFFAPVEGFEFIPFGDAGALERALAANPEGYAGFIVEPIQGEGGIVVPPEGYLRQVREICDRHGVYLIFDEVQTGLGRTGRLFACQEEGVTPDVMTLAKALGGGLVPVGACLATEAVYNEEFAMKHSSTFAGNALACRAGLAALERLTRDGGDLIREVARKGAWLKQRLEGIRQRYPQVIRQVRGRGLMLGIDFGIDRETFGSGAGALMGVMAEQEMLTPVIAAYLLNVEGLRVAPTLNGNSVIRMEPPLIVTDEQCAMAVDAIERTVALLARGDTAGLLGFLVGHPAAGCSSPPANRTPGPAFNGTADPVVVAERKERRPVPSGHPAEGRFAFLVHPLDLGNYHEFDRSLRAYSRQEMQALADRFNSVLEPFVVGQTRVVSAAGRTAYGEFVAVPRTTRQLLSGSREEMLGQVMAAVELAKERGARIVGLGAYTAIVSGGGRRLMPLGVPLTTGNSYTVVAAMEALMEGAGRLGLSLGESTAAVVGATGSIGRATALFLAEDAARLILVGNPGNPEKSMVRLERVAAEVLRHLAQNGSRRQGYGPGSLGAWLLEQPDRPAPEEDVETYIRWIRARSPVNGHGPGSLLGGRVVLHTDCGTVLPEAQLVVIATSSAEEFVTPAMLRPGALVCDMSRPPNVSRQVDRERPDVLVLDGGVIEVPGRPYFGWDFGYEPGLAYACMSETIMLALEHHYQHTSLGSDLTVETMLWLRELAQVHGFRLAGLRSFDRPLDEGRWQRLLQARERALEVAGV